MHESQLTIDEIVKELDCKSKITVEPLCAHCAATLFYELSKHYPNGYYSIYGFGPADFRLVVDLTTDEDD